MDFAEWIREQATKTYTENGAAARNTTGDARLDLFATIGSLRRADPERIELLFAEAYQADPLFALKILFYARDIREGLGERRVFRILLQYLAEYHPQAVIANLDLIGVFGRFDDWYCLIGTGVEDEMWSAMKQQLEADLKNFQEGKSVSLLAKWIKTADSKNTETLYPYDLVEKVLYGRQWNQVLEAQWRQLPDYVAQETNAIVIADVSGSMSGRPLATSIGLAIYFAERNRGAYHNLFMTFSQKPEFVSLRGETLLQKIKYVERTEWGMNTNLQAAFERVLETAMDHDVPPEEMPKALIVVSDMEIDRCGDRNWMFYDHMKEKYEYCGYQLPNIIFWNVDSRNDIFHADSRRKGVQLYSGQSVTTFQNLLNNIDSTPVKSMEKVIESERYACVRTGNAA